MSSDASIVVKTAKALETFIKGLKAGKFSNATIYIDEIPKEAFMELLKAEERLELEALTFRVAGDETRIVIPDCLAAKELKFIQEDPRKVSKISVSSKDRIYSKIYFLRTIADQCEIAGDIVIADMCHLKEIDQRTFNEFESISTKNVIFKNADLKREVEKTKDIKVCWYIAQKIKEEKIMRYRVLDCLDILSFKTSGLVNFKFHLLKESFYSMNFLCEPSAEDRQKIEISGVKSVDKFRLLYDAEKVRNEQRVIKTFFLSSEETVIKNLLFQDVPTVTVRLQSVEFLVADVQENNRKVLKILAEPVKIGKVRIELSTSLTKILLFCKQVEDITVVVNQLSNIEKCRFVIRTEHDINSLKIRYRADNGGGDCSQVSFKSRKRIRELSMRKLEEE